MVNQRQAEEQRESLHHRLVLNFKAEAEGIITHGINAHVLTEESLAYATRCGERPVASPHPDPLPQGEGTATGGSVFRSIWLGEFRQRYGRETGDKVSLSPGERVGVRGNSAFGSPRAPAQPTVHGKDIPLARHE